MIQRVDECGDVSVLWIDRKGVSYPVLVDTEDVERILAFPYSWRIVRVNARKCYVAAGAGGRNASNVYLHRFLLAATGKTDVDHRHADTLDNRKHKLREMSHQENMCNRQGPNRTSRNSGSGVRGVYWSTQRNKWLARITSLGKEHYLGLFLDKSDAATAVRTFTEQAAAA